MERSKMAEENEPREASLLEREVILEKDLADILGLSIGKLRDLRDNHGMPNTKVGNRRIYLESSILEWLKGREKNGN